MKCWIQTGFRIIYAVLLSEFPAESAVEGGWELTDRVVPKDALRDGGFAAAARRASAWPVFRGPAGFCVDRQGSRACNQPGHCHD